MIVSAASEWMTGHDRMPVLLEAEEFDAWLNSSRARAARSRKCINKAGQDDDDSTTGEMA